MTLASIRQQYAVPARLGGRVTVDGRPGRITGASPTAMHILVRFDDDNHSTPCHPTWEVAYAEETLPCGQPRCPHHAGLCAYHGDEPDRCPTCHSLWAAITRRGLHSCEHPAPGRSFPDRAARTAYIEAARARRQAAETRPWTGTPSIHCSHQPRHPTGSHRRPTGALAGPDPSQVPDPGSQAPACALSGPLALDLPTLLTPTERLALADDLARIAATRRAEAETRNWGMP